MRITAEERLRDAEVVVNAAKQFADTLNAEQREKFEEFTKQLVLWINTMDSDFVEAFNNIYKFK